MPIRILRAAVFAFAVTLAVTALARPSRAGARANGATEAAAAAMRLADAGRFAAAESLLAAQAPPPPDSAAKLDAAQAALERARLHARQYAAGMCDTTWTWRPARVIAALERAHARPEDLALAWAERARVEYRLGAWPAAVASGEAALALLDRARSRAALPRYRAHLALAEVVGAYDSPRAHAHLAAADSLAPAAGAAAALDRPRHRRIAGALAIMDGDMAGAARRMGACVAAADSLDPPNDAEAGLGLVLQGYAEGFSNPALGEKHRAQGRERLERTLGLGDERTLQALGRSVSNLDPALMPALAAQLERAQGWLRENGRTGMACAWDVDYFQSRVKISFGRYDESLELLEHALAVCRRWHGPGNIREMTTRTDIGIVHWLQKDTTAAIRELDRALELSARLPVSIPNDPNLPRNYLGMALVGTGRLAEAREMFRAMWESYRDRYGETFRLASLPASQVARCSRALGDSAQAELWYGRALLPFAAGENGTREEVANVRSSYALFLYGSGAWRRAFPLVLEGARLRREVVDETVPWLPENDALSFANGRRQDPWLLASLLLREPAADPALRCEAWSEVALGRGLVLEAMLRRARRASDPDSAAGALRRELATAVLASLKGSDTRAARERRDSLRAEIARREVGAGGAGEAAGTALRAGDVVRRLGGGALVSYLRARIYEKRDMIGDINFTPHDGYVAFVLAGGDSVPRAYWLGAGDSVDAAVHAWREASTAGASAAALAVAGERLRRLVWDPLLAALPAEGDVWFVPDAELQKVNFYALPSGPGRFLVDEPRVLHRLGSERDVLAPAPAAKASGVLAVGGVDYDRARAGTLAASLRGPSTLPSCRAFLEERFEPLPATAGEAAAIAALARTLSASGAGAPLTLTGLAADEASFKRLAPGKRVVHLATHSFCLGPECATGAGAASVVAQNPLVFSGIVLAGANRWQEARDRKEAEDGLLTAEELAGLDLRGTEWLVLSGCESGLGQVQAWEGVLGLPRAGRRAGVRTLVMSLAPVDDDAGAMWMRSLYEAHFARGEATALAVRTASRRVLDWLRRQGREPAPRLWAAFVAQGD